MPDHIFAIGDIHGCADELVELLELLPLTDDSTLVTLGDYVDRGPDACGVIEVLLEMGKHCELIALKGNHEQLFLDYLESDDEGVAAKFVLNGGGTTLRSYASGIGSAAFIPKSHIKFMRELRMSWETDDYFFVHAGVPDVPLSEIDLEAHGPYMLWARGRFLESEHRWDKVVVHGHSRMTEPQILEHRINLDTGCAYGGKLTAMGFPSQTVYSVAAQEQTRPRQASRRPDERRDTKRLGGHFEAVLEHPTAGKVSMQSVNVSSSGVLVQQRSRATPFPVNAIVRGTLRIDETTELAFRARVARRYRANHAVCYGLTFLESIERRTAG